MGKVVAIFRASVWLRVCTIASIILLVASFCVPPLGVIDSSVLAATGEIFGFGALWLVYIGLEKGVDAKIKRGDTEVSIDSQNKIREPKKETY